MKTTIISLVLVLFAVGCSKRESEAAPIRVEIVHGDIASPGAITTNHYQGRTNYCIQIKLSSAKEAELVKLAQQNSGRQVEIGFGSRMARIKMPAKALQPPIEWAVAFRSLDDARAAEEALKQLSQ